MSVLVKDGVTFVISPAGIRILSAFDQASFDLSQDITITSGSDGAHSGPQDPHHFGDAYDIHSKDFPDRDAALLVIMRYLGKPLAGSGGYVTEKFFGWLENAGTDNEHIHVQLRHGVIFP